jgi:streptogramin lyase
MPPAIRSFETAPAYIFFSLREPHMALFDLTELATTSRSTPAGPQFKIYDMPAHAWTMGVIGNAERAWFNMGDAIGILDAATGELTRIPRPPMSMAESLVRAPNGDIWFADTHSGLLCRIGAGNVLDSYPVGRKSRPTDILLDSSTSGWLSLAGGHAIVEFSEGQVVRQHDVDGDPAALGRLMDGSVWWLDIGTLACLGQPVESGNLPAGNLPTNMVSLAGELWFGDIGRSEICRLSADRRLYRYRLAEGLKPFRLAAGPDHAIWFTTMGDSWLCRIDTDGHVSRAPTPGAPSIAFSYVAGDAAGLWLSSSTRGGGIIRCRL